MTDHARGHALHYKRSYKGNSVIGNFVKKGLFMFAIYAALAVISIAKSAPKTIGMRGNEIADELAKGGLCSPLCGTRASCGGLKAVHKKKNSVLDEQTALGTMAGTGWHYETGSRVDLGALILKPGPR
jgi:hypothetical protein